MQEVKKMHDVVLEEFMSNENNKTLHEVSLDIAITGHAKWIYFFILKILNKNIEQIESIDNATLNKELIIFNALKEIIDIDIIYLRGKIIDTASAEYIYKFQKNIISLLKELEIKKYINEEIKNLINELKNTDLTDEIVKTKNLKYIYRYSSNIKTADNDKIYQAVLKSKNPKLIYMFAKNNKEYDKFMLANRLIEIGNAKYMYLFARDIDIDPKIFEEPISLSNSAKYIYLFAKNIEGINIRILQEAIMETKNVKYICEFARNIECNFERFEDDAIIYLNAEYIYELAKFDKSNKRRLEDAIKDTKNPKYMYLFAKNIKGVSISAMELQIVKANNPEYMYLFAKNVKGADIKYIGSMMFKTNDMKWIFKFFNEIPNADILYAVEQMKKFNLDPENKYTEELIRKYISLSLIPIIKKNILLGYMYNDIFMPINELKSKREYKQVKEFLEIEKPKVKIK